MKSLTCKHCQYPLASIHALDEDYDGDECFSCLIGGLQRRIRKLEEALIKEKR